MEDINQNDEIDMEQMKNVKDVEHIENKNMENKNIENAEKNEQADATSILETKNSEKKSLFRFRSKDKHYFSRDEWILLNIRQEEIMDYLRLEQSRMERIQASKDERGKRVLRAFELTVCLIAITLIIYFLKSNPTILVTILYTIGLVAALWIWKKPKDKERDANKKDDMWD